MYPTSAADDARCEDFSISLGHKPAVPMIALAEENLVVEPSQGFSPASVAPSHNSAAGRVGSERQPLDGHDFYNEWLGHWLIVRNGHSRPPASGFAPDGGSVAA